MSLVYKTLGKRTHLAPHPSFRTHVSLLVEEVTTCYENALKKHPDSADLLGLVFQSYIKRAEWQKAQQIALRLYKQSPADKMMRWAAVCLYMHVRPRSLAVASVLTCSLCSQGRTQNSRPLLFVAEKMLEKMNQEGKITTVEGRNTHPTFSSFIYLTIPFFRIEAVPVCAARERTRSARARAIRCAHRYYLSHNDAYNLLHHFVYSWPPWQAV